MRWGVSAIRPSLTVVPSICGVRGCATWSAALRPSCRWSEPLRLRRTTSASASRLAWCYKRTGRLDLAIESLEQTLIVEPDEPLLRYNLACYLSLAGQKRRALRQLSQALAIDPTYRKLAENESDFDPLRADPEFKSLFGLRSKR